MTGLFFTKLAGWLRRLIEWVSEAKIVLFGFLSVAVALYLALVFWRTESAIRCTGYTLQFLGMVLAIRGLISIRQFFGKPSIRSTVCDWFKRFPLWKKGFQGDLQANSISVSSARASMEIWNNDDPSLNLEQRLEAIVRNQERLREEQRKHENMILLISDNLEHHKNKTESEYIDVSKNLNMRLESLHTSELTASLVGLFFLTVGITLGTLSLEISNWLK